MFFLLLLVGATVALPLQSQPETEDTLPVIDWNLVKVSLGEESDNLFDDILKAVQVATPIVTALAGKRDVADSEWFDTFLAAVEAATPTIVDVIQGAGTTREVADSEWFDTFLAAVEAATPTILGVIQGATTTREVADAEWFNTLINAVEAFTPTIVGMINNVKQRKDIDWDYMLQVIDQSTPLVNLSPLLEPGKKRQAETEVQDTMYIDGSVLLDSITPVVSPVINILTGKRQAESEDTLFELLVDAIGVLGPAIAAGKRNMNWPTVLDIPIIQPLIVPALSKKAINWDLIKPIIEPLILPVLSKREINWDLIKPIIEPLILPVLSKRALETQDINFEKFGIYSRPDLVVPLITAEDLDPAFLAGKRNLENQDNLLDIFVDALGVLAPVISAGKRDLESQDNLLDIFVDALGVLAPVISAGKKRCWGCILDDLKVIEVPTPLITVGRREITYWEAFQKYLDEGGIFPAIPEGVIIVKKEA